MQIITKYFHFYGLACLLFCLTARVTPAQTNEFTYQGKLSVSGTTSATYDFEFRLCASESECSKPLATQQRLGVPVFGSVFTVKLDFEAANFDGSNRWLEIAVKRPAETDFTTLLPRAPVTSAPYAIRSLNAGVADNSTLFGGLTTNGFVQNTTMTQTGNFNLSGNGTLGGSLTANEIKAQTETGTYGLTHTDGATTLSTYVGGSSSGATGAWFGTRSNSPLFFYTNSGQPQLTILQNGNVGIGTATPSAKLDVAGNIFTNGSLNAAGNIFTSGFLSVGNGAGITGSLNVSNGFTVSNGLSVNTGNLNVNNGGATISGSIGVGNGLNVSNGLAVNSGGLTVAGTANFGTVLIGLAAGTPDTDICRNFGTRAIVSCASSLRYKSNVETFGGGLSILNRLRPISFTWKSDGQRDIGFGAEEVFQIEPLLTTRNDAGEIEGVKYKLFSVVLVDAVKEQQTQIERQNQQIQRQQQQIDALTRLVCSQNPQAEICKEQ